MNLFKLNTHQKSFGRDKIQNTEPAEDLLLNPKEHPTVKIGDVVEIYHPEEDGCRLLLQVTCMTEAFKGHVSVEENLANQFNLRKYFNVIMRVVNPATVALDSVEITFRDQYMGRSEMWRLKSYLTNTCVYLNKSISFCNKSIRCQIYEMWAQGERVSCGVINEDTKIVFRSSTSMVYLFIQMSSEMWDFDIHGDLYFEKAVNGFLTDLFMKWKKLGSNHEVTIVLFSRTFYSAKSLDEFPAHMRECLQMDYKGRYYEDFYRVAIQNERNDDWSTMLVQLRRLFTSYQTTVLKYHNRTGVIIPTATNSTAAQGNFLEVLNISLNVFEKHYLDRSFDRTGQLSVVITPGVGVFEVDRELTNITKQRIIDNGVGSDLVCVGEQPLHAVPLLKFHNKDSSLSAADDYSMPHWINLSFYSTNKKVAYSTFIPRIKLPPLKPEYANDEDNAKDTTNFFHIDNAQQSEYIHNSLFDYDAYDAQVFTFLPATETCSLQRAPRAKKTSVPCLEGFGTCTTKEWENIIRPKQQPPMRRKMSDPDIHFGTTNVLSNLSSHNGSPIISESMSTIEKTGLKNASLHPASSKIMRPGRALINPFAPSHVTIKLTSNRRRWTHIFPKGPTGVLIQQHHYQAVPTANGVMNQTFYGVLNTDRSTYGTNGNVSGGGGGGGGGGGSGSVGTTNGGYNNFSTLNGNFDSLSLSSMLENGVVPKRKNAMLHSAAGPSVTVEPSKSLTLLWGATGEQEWTPALTTAGKIIIGVDWKSLTIPACLPITTDYFPDKRSLHNDYVVSDYTLLPEGVNSDYAENRAIYRCPLTTEEVFWELISQRLAQGFQLIVTDKIIDSSPNVPSQCCGSLGSTGGNSTLGANNSNGCGNNLNGNGGSGIGGILLHRHPSRLDSGSYSNLSISSSHNNNNNSNSISRSPLQKLKNSTTTPLNMTNSNKKESIKEYLLSIGRIFHKITLNDSVITVTRYRPRHPYPPINVDYRYRFKAPQHDTYEVSGVNFTTEKLENFNWNYMDQYICTRGDSDYSLQENLKYWRHRLYLLPKEQLATKKIMEMYASSSSPSTNTNRYCDIYTDCGAASTMIYETKQQFDQQKHQIDEFVRFLETYVNKFKKTNCQKCSKGSPTTQQTHLTRRRHSTSIISRPPPNQALGNSPFRERVGSNRLPAMRPRSGSKVLERGPPGRISPATEAGGGVGGLSSIQQPETSNLVITSEDNEETFLTEAKLSCNATISEIFDAFKHPITGVNFLAKAQSLPSYTFVLWDAINWLQSHIEGINVNPLEKLEEMRKEGMIGHASGNCSRPIVSGFYLYYISQQDKKSADYIAPLNDLEIFENEWMEVEIPYPQFCSFNQHLSGTGVISGCGGVGNSVEHELSSEFNIDDITTGNSAITTTAATISSSSCNTMSPIDDERFVPLFLRETVELEYRDDLIYKQSHLEIDPGQQKSDRIEWGHVRYHNKMKPGHAFEIVVQWLTSSGPIVYDLVSFWTRKAQQCNFQLIPIPADPLAEPFTDKSDPLRGPIFIPLNLHCLEKDGMDLFKEFKKDSWPDRLLLLQEAIVSRFGFLSCYAETKTGSNRATLDRQYVHCTGNMFILVASPNQGLKIRHRLASGGTMKKPTFLKRFPKNVSESPQAVSTLDTYVTRHVNVKNKEEFDVPRKIGFLWSWNHMIANKKWKSLVLTNSPDGEIFQLRMLQDFKDFCSNQNDRLVRFWEESWIAKEKSCTTMNQHQHQLHHLQHHHHHHHHHHQNQYHHHHHQNSSK